VNEELDYLHPGESKPAPANPASNAPKKKFAAYQPLVPLRRITVSINFYNLIFRKYFPVLNKYPAYRNLFWYLLFGSYHDKKSQRLLLHRELLAKLAGKPLANFEAGKFLRDFDRNVLGGGCLVWTNADWENEKCRQLLRLKLGEDFQKDFETEKWKKWHKFGRVYLNGQKFSEAKARLVRQEQRRRAELQKPECPHAISIQQYLNNLPLQLFTAKCKANYLAALKCASETLLPEYRQREFRILKYIDSQPKPFYSASANRNSVRLFSSESIPNLERHVRKAFTKGWLDGDLKCSQLAICAWMWNVKPMMDFLKTGRSFWNHLYEYLEIPSDKTSEVKPILKEATYGLCYGMPEKNIRSYLTKEFNRLGIQEKSSEFVTEPLLHAMLEAREAAIGRITQQGGDKTCYGKELIINKDLKARDILAQMAQAWELKLIYPAFELAAAHPKDFKIMIYLFDGFSVHFHRYPDKWMKRIKDVVDRQAKELGVPTYLEWDK
jgi:hypothetical protein